MRVAVLPEADRDVVRERVLRVLRDAGAEVEEATHSHLRFRALRPAGEHSFARGGYVGLHTHAGEKDITLRVLARASAPRRAFFWTSGACLAAAVLLFALQPPPNVWVVAAFLLWPPWIGAAVAAGGARRVDHATERDLHERIVAALRADGRTVLNEADVRRRDFELAVEGEIAEKRLKKTRSSR